ncbi:hypothetical protein [Mesorhizobium amorphae]|uniref:hypothetical protein n=1 Tax=Mesorhizobium amorphae TaxID=71433 RepID=UPI00177BD546|nr:hypothetical protein [Mesorhizobium amorphae]
MAAAPKSCRCRSREESNNDSEASFDASSDLQARDRSGDLVAQTAPAPIMDTRMTIDKTSSHID